MEYSADDDCFVGRVFGIADVLCFDGSSTEELRSSFHTCIDEYLALCKEFGKSPDKEFKGTFNVRIPPELHRSASIYAAENNMSLNQVVSQSIESYLLTKEPCLVKPN